MFQPNKEWWAGQFHIPENLEYKESFFKCQLIFSLKFPSCVKTWINVCNGVKSSFFTLFVRFILGFPFLLNRFLGLQMHWLFKRHGSHKPRTNNLFHSGSLSCLLLVIIIPSRFSWQFQLKNGGQVSFIFQITRNPRNPWLKCFLYHESSAIDLFTNRLSKQLINSSKINHV